MTWPDLKLATWRQKALYPVTNLLSFPVRSEVLLPNEYILHSKWQMASIKTRSLRKHSCCWAKGPTVLLTYSFRPLELICQFYKLNVSVESWRKMPGSHIALGCEPFLLCSWWEGKQGLVRGLRRDVRLRELLISIELKPYLSYGFIIVTSATYKRQQGLQTLQWGGNWVSSATTRGKAHSFSHYCEAVGTT